MIRRKTLHRKQLCTFPAHSRSKASAKAQADEQRQQPSIHRAWLPLGHRWHSDSQHRCEEYKRQKLTTRSKPSQASARRARLRSIARGLGDVGCRDGSGSRAGMKLLLKGKQRGQTIIVSPSTSVGRRGTAGRDSRAPGHAFGH
jgi:hypothetical protein